MRTKAIFLLAALLASFTLLAQDNKIEKQKFHFGKDQDTSAGYAQAIKVGKVLYISGTVGLDITPENVKRVYTTLERTLKHFGATFQNVVKENLYTTDIEAMKAANEARKSFYKGDFPAATWVEIKRLYMPNAKLEVELIAHLP